MPEISIEQAIQIATREHEAGHLPEAEHLYRQVLGLEPDHDDALRLLGILMMQKGRTAEAIDLTRRAIALNPGVAQYYVNLGNALKSANDLAGSIDAYRQALKLNAGYPQALYNLGLALVQDGQPAAAVEAYQRALQLNPGYFAAQSGMGLALAEMGRIDGAIAAYHAALQINPNDADVYVNLGNALRAGNDRLGESAAAFEQAIRLNPGYAVAHWNLATLLLSRGNFQRGLIELEWRWKWKDFPTRERAFAQPRWDGRPLNGQSILLHHEQGLGDTIQFIRYAPRAAARGGKVIVQCPPELSRLLKTVEGVAQVITADPVPSFDVQCPMMSLPLACSTALETIPAAIPYLKVDPDLARNWREKIDASPDLWPGKLKVGLVWAGRATNQTDHRRSIALSHFAPLRKAAGAVFYSLQKGQGAAQLQSNGALEMIDLTGGLQDFADTAALVSHLDLVICVDTAVAHLAGALGKAVWVLIPFGPDWRWMLHRDDTPWYPTMRLFRQKSPGDWAQVIERVEEELTDLCQRMSVIRPQSLARGGTRFSQSMERGAALLSARQIEAAIDAFNDAVQIEPGNPKAHYCLGGALAEKGAVNPAIDAYQHAVRLQPDFVNALNNLGGALRDAGRFHEALDAYRRVLAIHPDWPEIHWNIALILLLQGDYAQGWVEYEWRRRCEGHESGAPAFSQPQWDGSPLHGKTLLLHTEQGLGDAIQFVRYAPLLAARGARVILGCPSALCRLLKAMPGVEQLVRTLPLPHFDLYCPLMSLPLLLGTRVDSIPASPAYLKADEILAHAWSERIKACSRAAGASRASSRPELLKVGVAWAGGANYKHDRHRSMPFAQLAALSRVPGASFCSLQKGPAAEQAQAIPPGMNWIDCSADLHDLADTAALISNLDLVITVDTVIAHLAGALGKPVWVLLPKVPDWRWMLDREDSPWYPSARLFRQSIAGDWAEVIERVARRLAEQVREKRGHDAANQH